MPAFRFLPLALILALATGPVMVAAQVNYTNCSSRLKALGECGKPKSAGVQRAGNTRTERALSQQARAMQRTIAEGVAVGAALGGAVDVGTNNKNNSGLTVGITLGAAAGSYVARLQRRYAQKERQLEKVRDDITEANRELEAAIATMRSVVALQQQQLAAIRAGAGPNRQLQKELGEAEANLSNMRAAIKGAEGWEKEFQSTRSLKLVRGQLTGVDREIAALSQRIENMRRIAETLNGAIQS